MDKLNELEALPALAEDIPEGREEIWRQLTVTLDPSQIVRPLEDNQGQPIVKAWVRKRRRRILDWSMVAGCAEAVMICLVIVLLLL